MNSNTFWYCEKGGAHHGLVAPPYFCITAEGNKVSTSARGPLSGCVRVSRCLWAERGCIPVARLCLLSSPAHGGWQHGVGWDLAWRDTAWDVARHGMWHSTAAHGTRGDVAHGTAQDVAHRGVAHEWTWHTARHRTWHITAWHMARNGVAHGTAWHAACDVARGDIPRRGLAPPGMCRAPTRHNTAWHHVTQTRHSCRHGPGHRHSQSRAPRPCRLAGASVGTRPPRCHWSR